MSKKILSSLLQLQKYSGKQLNPIITSYLQDNSQALTLVRHVQIANSKWGVKHKKGDSALLKSNNTLSVRKIKNLSGSNKHIINKLNTELLGGESYPILVATLGIAVGLASGGAGLIFAVATTGLSLANTSRRVLARMGDEIWQVEQIGKEGDKPMYVSAYFIIDPYRKRSSTRGWLIHEERHEVLLG